MLIKPFWADMLNKRKWAVLLAVILVVASGAALAEYFVHSIAPLSIVVPDDYPTIQAAIGNCTPGSTIHVRNGNYNELLTIDKPLTLIGENRQNTIINGQTQKYASFVTIEIQADNVQISNFSIAGSDYGIGMSDNSSNCLITGNDIQAFDTGIGFHGKDHKVTGNNIRGSWYWGIHCYANNALISENVIEDSIGGIFIEANNVTIENNTIANAKINNFGKQDSAGIALGMGDSNRIYGNILRSQNTGILYEGANRSQVFNNSITQNLVGVTLLNYVFINTTSGGKDNLFFNNNIVDNDRQAIIETALQVVSAQSNGTDVVSWDNGSVGNYWSDNQNRYPDATQNSNTGTYNTPYTIDVNNKDNHPLILAANSQLS
jgi:hypothetical protein